MGYYESKKVNIIPGRAGSVFGPSKLLLDGGGLTKIPVLTLITLYF